MGSLFQRDFLDLFTGLGFLFLAGAAWAMRPAAALRWRWLAAFGAGYAAYSWLGLLSALGEDGGNGWLLFVRLTVLGLSLLAWLEFGRAGIFQRSSQTALYVYPAALAAASVIVAFAHAQADSWLRWMIGWPAGVLATLALLRAADTAPARNLQGAGVATGVLALILGLSAATPQGPGLDMVSAVFQPVSALTACLLGVCLWRTQGLLSRRAAWATVPLLLILVAGWTATEHVTRSQNLFQRTLLLDKATLMATSVNAAQVRAFTATEADTDTPGWQGIRDQLSKMQRSAARVRFVYLMGVQNNRLLFLLDTTPQSSADYSAPGLPYDEAPPQVMNVFATGAPVTVGPYADRWGTFISAFVPVFERAGTPPVSVLGVDMNMQDWNRILLRHRLMPILITLLATLLWLVCWTAALRIREAARLTGLAEHRFRSLFEEAGCPLLLVNPETGRITNANTAACSFYGYTPLQLTSMTLPDLETDGAPGIASAARLAAAAGEPRQPLAVQHLLANREVRDMEICAAAMPERNGTPQMLCLLTDLTQLHRTQEELRHERERVRQYLDAASVVMLALDTRCNVQQINRYGCTLLGLPESEIVGKNWIEHFLPEITRVSFHEVFSQVLGNSVNPHPTHENPILVRGGKMRIVLWHTSALHTPDGAVTGMLCSGIDITERTQHEVALMQAKDEAETANQRLKQSIEHAEKMAAEAQAANAGKNLFLAHMSHEIRTPMSSILGLLELLRQTPLATDQREMAEAAHRSADALLVIVNDILDFAHIESGKMTLDLADFDVRQLVEHLIDVQVLHAREKGLELVSSVDPGIPASLNGDGGKLRQVLLNLITNAIKYTHAGDVTVRAALDREEPDACWLRFSVTDTGKGITQADLALLFQPYSRLTSPAKSRQVVGTGLGLFIAKQFVDLMQGQIGVESQVSRGSTFWFTVRLLKTQASPVSQPAHSSVPDGIRVLVVDDNASARRAIVEAMESMHVRADEAADAPGALIKLGESGSEQPYRAVLIDLEMPQVDGRKLGELIQSNPKLDTVARILMVPSMQRSSKESWISQGYADVLTKPVKPDALAKTLARILKKTSRPESGKQAVGKASAHKSHGGPARILLAEDNLMNQKLFLRILNKKGHHIDVVVNGRDAVEALKKADYDLVLMDIQMPELDGLEAARLIRNPATGVRNPRIPIIAMTAYAMADDRKLCVDAGMNDYIAKPIRLDEFHALVDHWLSPNPD